MVEIDWAERWKRIVEDRETLASGHADTGYWDRRSSSYARSTQSRVDDFLKVLEPYLSPRKTLIDVGAGAGRHATPLAERLEWVTAVEPSEGMRSHIPTRDNMTVIASSWEDAEVAPADLVICSHVLYGVADPVPFIDSRARFGQGWDEAAARAALEEILRRDGDDLVFDGGLVLSGVAHWKPQT